jgi:hypothetical protein
MEDEISESDIIEAERHAEMVSLLKKLISVSSESDNSDALISAIKQSIGDISDSVRRIPQPKDVDFSPIAHSITKAMAEINKNILLLTQAYKEQSKPKEWNFEIQRYMDRTISSVKATQK